MGALCLVQCAPGLALRRGTALDAPEVRAFLARVQSIEQTRTSMSGGGTLSFRHKSVPLSAQVNLGVGIGGRVRIDVSTDAGNVLLAFAANPRRIALIDFERRQLSERPAGANDLAALSIAALDARALSALLLGRLPCAGFPSGADDTHLEYAHCLGGTILATYASAPDGSPLLRELTLSRGGATPLRAALQAHTAQGFARRITLETPDNRLVVQLEELEANPTLDDELFELSAPPGIATP